MADQLIDNSGLITGECPIIVEDECPPGCEPTPEYPFFIGEFTTCGTEVETDYSRNMYLSSDGEYVTNFDSTGGGVLTNSLVPVMPILYQPEGYEGGGTGFFRIVSAIVHDDILYTLHEQPNYGTMWLSKRTVPDNVLILQDYVRDGGNLLYGNGGDISLIVRDGLILAVYNANSATESSAFAVDITTLTLTLPYAIDWLSATAGRCLGFCFTGGNNAIYAMYEYNADPTTAKIYTSSSNEGASKTELVIPGVTATDYLRNIVDLGSSRIAVAYETFVILLDYNGIVIKRIEGGAYTVTPYNTNNAFSAKSTISAFQDKFIIVSPGYTYKKETNVGVGEVFSLDTGLYLFTVNIPTTGVLSGRRMSKFIINNYGLFRTNPEDAIYKHQSFCGLSNEE